MMEKSKISDFSYFFTHCLKSYGIDKKITFLLFFNHLKTETRKNSEICFFIVRR